MRRLSPLDALITHIDTALQTLIPPTTRATSRGVPGEPESDEGLSGKEQQHIAGLMRINHAGEVCAQALYQGQAMTARLDEVRDKMAEAAEEEVEHLAWCETRLSELDSRPSHLNVFWYGGSLLIGALAGLAGDKWSLGFVAETERQVTAHLEEHLAQLPPEDQRTKAILEQMRLDEMQHATVALDAGGAELPMAVKWAMGRMSKVMTRLAYHI